MKEAIKTDIKKGKFIVVFKNGDKISFPVKELDKIIPSGCEYCIDFSGVESDVSVGSVGSKDGYSSVVVREKIAKDVLDYIFEKKYAIKDDVNVEIIRKLCELKKKRYSNLFRLQSYKSKP